MHRRLQSQAGVTASRPYRQPLSHNSAPIEKTHRTPTLIRAARARALAIPKATPIEEDDDPRTLVAAHALPATKLTTNTQHTRNSLAQQMQARALAAQTAHQQRIAEVSRSRERNPALFPIDPDDEEFADLMDDIQVDLSLQVREDDHIDSPVVFTSPSAKVDISAFLPPPGPPVLIANDETVAASAVPLSDWAADMCFRLLHREIGRTRSGDALAWLKDVPARGLPASPESFRGFVHSTFSATLASPQCLFLGLLYVSRLPIGRFRRLPAELDNANTPPGVVALFTSLNAPQWSPAEVAFRDALYGPQRECLTEEQLTEFILTLAVMLGNKWLEDNTFTTRTWHDVTSLSQRRLRTIENAALDVFNFSLAVPDEDWATWLTALRSHASLLVAREAIGVKSQNAVVLGRIDQLIAASRAVHHDTLETQVQRPSEEIRSRTHSRMVSMPSFKFPDENSQQQDVFPHHRPNDWTPDPIAVEKPSRNTIGTNGRAPRANGHIRMWSNDRVDAGFPLVAIHPNAVNANTFVARQASSVRRHNRSSSRGGWSLVDSNNRDNSQQRWEQIPAELAIRELEQESSVSGWPHPGLMDWSATWSGRRSSAIIGN
jgi:hypothetical protein